jgi:hypothetical protein
VFVIYEQAHFDSDQAIVGLMARDIARGEAAPLFLYGQRYILAVEPWIAAPFVGLLGATVAALKLPLLILNLVVAALLVTRLVRDQRLTPPAALVASLFILVPPPIPASRMVEAGGAQIEPFVWVLLLWMLRRHAIWFGVVLAVGALNREFTLYAPVALAVVAAIRRRLFDRDVIRRAFAAAAAFAIVFGAGQLLAPIASPDPPVLGRPGLSWPAPTAMAARLGPLIADTLAVVAGARTDALAPYNIRSALETGHPGIGVLLAIIGVLAIARLAGARRGHAEPPAFAIYLLLIGLIAAVAPLALPESGGMRIRYALLALFLPVGGAAVYLARERQPLLRTAVMAAVAVWAAAAAWDHLRLLNEYQTRRPPNVYRELAIYLESNGHRYGWADYWTAYHAAFLAQERVILSPRDVIRIPGYHRLVEAHAASAVEIRSEPCDGGARLRQWYICR